MAVTNVQKSGKKYVKRKGIQMKKKLLMTLFMATILGSSMTVSAGFTPMYKPALKFQRFM